ncbi:MAG: PGPGW domain-containing protein [Acidobacteriota bacterium]
MRATIPPLSLPVRIALLILGWALVVIGVVGLVLPVIQGWLTLFAGFAVLSIVSQSFHRFLRRRFHGWPKGWRRMEKLRRRLGRYLAK